MTPAPKSRWSFSLRTLFVVMTVIGVGAGSVAMKLQQDYSKMGAQREIASLGLDCNIRSWEGYRLEGEFVSTKSELTDTEVDRLVRALAAVGRRHDLGLSKGVDVVLLDMSKSHLSQTALYELRQAFPYAEIWPKSD